MKDFVMIGRGEKIHEVSADDWRRHLAGARQHAATRLHFMTGDHHLVRNFVVSELPRNQGKPLRTEEISRRINLPLSRITTVLEDLEKNLFFLVRNDAGEISWAFPVTTERTPHRLSFSTGERIFAA